MFYNTTNEENPQLDVFCKKADSQDNLITDLFLCDPPRKFTPSEVWQKLIRIGNIDKDTPLTSIRRSINTLTKEGILRKLDEKRIGFYGRPESCWIRNGQNNTRGFLC